MTIMADNAKTPILVTLGMFILDEFEFLTEDGEPTGKTIPTQIGGGGTYAAIGARVWLQAHEIGMVVDRGFDFPSDIQSRLLEYGPEMWFFREQANGGGTTRALNSYRGEQRGFRYLTPRTRITPRDLEGTRLEKPEFLHFICSPSRALAIMSEVQSIQGWNPTTIYEPIPDRCVPEELPSLVKVLPSISILSPNAEEALSLLSLPQPPSKQSIEQAAQRFLDLGVGVNGKGAVIVRSGAMGSFVKTHDAGGLWIDAFWTGTESKVVDVTGAGNSFLGGLAAGLKLTGGDVYEATLYASVSASFTIEQQSLPLLNNAQISEWNGDSPERRLGDLKRRVGSIPHYVYAQ
ncbi:Ribokinase-like protein [Pluteus cervinus]|uniref:Ribokinase-like protein n=1 Tax=Pluteus cervinus TaxID=181527 RepID=A0ACD3BEN9_9AGAR|nr:Ribokinase-like protein [Pluteus cervinus]